MMCNYMTEGCAGGFNSFTGIFAQHSYLVEEDCAPYKGSTKGSSCAQFEKCKPYAKVKKTNFVGKGFGDASEANLMKELVHSGPIAVEVIFP